jgi:hypothetical protein
MFGIRGNAAAGVTGESHFVEFVDTDLICVESAKFVVPIFIGGITKIGRFICLRSAVLTCIRHGSSPSDDYEMLVSIYSK